MSTRLRGSRGSGTIGLAHVRASAVPPANSRRSLWSGNGAASAVCSISSSARSTSCPSDASWASSSDQAPCNRVAATTSGSRSFQRSSSPSGRYFPDRCANGRRSGTSRLRRIRALRRSDALDDLGATSRTAQTSIPSTVRVGIPSPRRGAGSHRASRRRSACTRRTGCSRRRRRRADRDLREVQALEEVRLVRRAVAEIRDRDAARPLSEIAAPVAAAMLPPTIP